MKWRWLKWRWSEPQALGKQNHRIDGKYFVAAHQTRAGVSGRCQSPSREEYAPSINRSFVEGKCLVLVSGKLQGQPRINPDLRRAESAKQSFAVSCPLKNRDGMLEGCKPLCFEVSCSSQSRFSRGCLPRDYSWTREQRHFQCRPWLSTKRPDHSPGRSIDR